MAHAGKHHGNAGFVGSGDHFLVAHRATRLDHGADTGLRRVVDAVTEGEEGVGCHDCTLHLQTGVLGLDRGDARGVDAAHLPGADADGLAVLGVDDGVGLDELGHLPGEHQVVDFLLGGRTLGDHLEVVGGDHADVAALHQQTTVDALEVPARRAFGRPLAAFEQAHVGLGGDDFAGFGADGRGDDDFDELALDDGAGGFTVQLAVEGDDATEGRFAVGGIGQVISLADAAFVLRHHGHAAGVGVLDDDAGRLDEALHAFKRGIGVGDVVERQLLALQLARSGHAGLVGMFDVEGGDLVRVLAVAHVLRLDELGGEGARQRGAVFGGKRLGGLVDGAQVVGDHAVVGRGVLEGLQRQVEALGVGQAAGLQAFDHLTIVVGVDHDGDVLVVLRRAADHGRAADIDVLDGVGQGAARLGHGGGEGVEIDRHEVDRGDAMLAHHRAVQITAAENAAVDLRVQGLDPAVHHFREASVVGDFDGGDVVFTQQLEGAAGGQDFDAEGSEFAGEVDDAGLVGHADQCAANGKAEGMIGHFRAIRVGEKRG